MPWLNLSSGKYRLKVCHDRPSKPPEVPLERRGTTVLLSSEDKPVNWMADSICSLKDQFCKRTGRLIAAKRLLELLNESTYFSKEDRRTVFHAICPEFSGKKGAPK